MVLVKTDKNVDIDFSLENCRFKTFDEQKVKAIFNELGFNSLLDRLPTIIFE